MPGAARAAVITEARPADRRRIEVRGAFDLGQSIRFGFGQRESTEDDVMRLAFVVDGYREQVGVAVRQQAPGVLDLEISGIAGLNTDLRGADVREAVDRQVARVLSVDVDSTGFDGLGARDPLIGRLQKARPGLRPPLFYSAYEALAWSVLSARRPHRQMAALRDSLGAAHGAAVEVAGQSLPVFPTPEQLLAVEEFPGLPDIKLRRLHGVARAALDGRLDTANLRALPPEVAAAQLQELEGIGPFYAQLVVIRALGHTDVLPSAEPTVLQVAGRLLGGEQPLSQDEFATLAAAWAPWRTWAAVAVRAAGPLLI
jgi:DNA-3-methyladenine glycosylase II